MYGMIQNQMGPLKKLLDVSKLNNLGWNYKINLKDGIEETISNFKNELNKKKIRL